jgi:hypothetical protein
MDQDAKARAESLHDDAMARDEQGDEAAALGLYLEALALDHARPNTLYNVGLIYKYRRDWEKSARYNRQAIELRPDDPATNWNLAIAATALRDWKTVRECWQRMKLEVAGEEGPIVGNHGFTPVRLNGFDEGEGAPEVVWACRLSPVTARIDNIPTLEARFRYGDVVLHDGAGNGTRLDTEGRERPVFDVFELFEPSDFVTVEAVIDAPDEQAVEALEAACKSAGIECEDWTANMNLLCKACSEGTPHEAHDHGPREEQWQISRRFGMATRDPLQVERVLDQWCAGDPGRRVESL